MVFLDIIRRPGFCLKQRFGDWILSPSSGETYTFGQIDGANSYVQNF
jgi:hypothetical protein